MSEQVLTITDYETEILPRLTGSKREPEFRSLSIKEQQKLLPYLDETLKAKVPLREIVGLRQTAVYRRSE